MAVFVADFFSMYIGYGKNMLQKLRFLLQKHKNAANLLQQYQ